MTDQKVIKFSKVFDPEFVPEAETTFKDPEMAQEMARRWNLHEELIEALLQSTIALNSAWYKLEAGFAKLGDQFIMQDDCQKIINNNKETLKRAKGGL